MARLHDFLSPVPHGRPGPPPGRRALGLVLAAALAIASLAPGAAFAREVDSEGEGAAPPGLEDPELEPGGEEPALADVPGSGVEGGDAEDEGEGPPVEAEPPLQPEVTEAPTAPEAVALPAAPESEAPAPAAPEVQIPQSPEPAPSYEPAPPPSPAEPVENQALVAPPSQSDGEQARHEPAEVAPAPESPASIEPVRTPDRDPKPEATAPPVAVRGGVPSSLKGRPSYTVRPGDTLWSIAKALLAPSASDAEVAARVERLWALNRDRIATGDPDLILVGTVLRLR